MKNNLLFTIHHENATVIIDHSNSHNSIIMATIKFNDGDIAATTARTMAEVNSFVNDYWDDLGDVVED